MKQKARLLDISEATLRKYRAKNEAPRAVHLALFWESVWGIGYHESYSDLRTSTYYALAESLKRKNQRLMGQIAELEAELARSKTGAANSPIFNIG